jgi:hypothetical protein
VRGALPVAVRDARFKYLRSTGDTGRDKPILTDLRLDEESHDLSRRQPEVAARLADALERMRHELAVNPRGWR